jgi:hypothetical protein
VIAVTREKADEAHARARDLEAVSDDTVEQRLARDEPGVPDRDAAEVTGPRGVRLARRPPFQLLPGTRV